MRLPEVEALITRAFCGDERAIARIITLIENSAESNEADVVQLFAKILEKPRKAYRIGVTGPPGVGKSTLISRLIGAIRREDETVGVLCIDPSSPISKGALLGDRIRMEDHFLDRGVFIRSMSVRGSYGAIPRCLSLAVQLLDACGKDFVIVETVGVGQQEPAIKGIVDVTVLVLAPGWGDSVQFMKAGIIEVADIIVVNKTDTANSSLSTALREILELGNRKPVPPIVETQAIRNQGIDELLTELKSFTVGSVSRIRR